MGGTTIQLAAPYLRPPEQPPNILEMLTNIERIRGLQQGQQLQQEQLKSAQMSNQMTQREMQDQDTIRQALASNPGKTYGDILPELQGKIQPKMWATLVEADQKIKKGYSDQTAADLDNSAKIHQQYGQIYNSVMNMPDEQVQANWPQIVQAINAIPGNKLQLNPQQPLSKQQLGQYGPMLSLSDAYLQSELEKRGKQADISYKQAETANMQKYGSAQPSDTDKYIARYLDANHLPDTPENRQTAFNEYTRTTKVQPRVAGAQIFLNRPTEVADPNNPGQTLMVPGSQSFGMPGKSSASVQVPRANALYMTSGKGGQQITAFNTAIAHLDTLRQMGDALGNGDVRLFNNISQRYAEETGNPAPANFDAARNALSGEVASALKASGATDQEIHQVQSTFSKAQSPQQIEGVINTYQTLLRSKRSALYKQYQAGQQGKPAFDSSAGSQAGNAAPGGGAVKEYDWVPGKGLVPR